MRKAGILIICLAVLFLAAGIFNTNSSHLNNTAPQAADKKRNSWEAQKVDISFLEPYYGTWKVVEYLGYRFGPMTDVSNEETPGEILGRELKINKYKVSFGDKEVLMPEVNNTVLSNSDVISSFKTYPGMLGMKWEAEADYNYINVGPVNFFIIDDRTLVILKNFAYYRCARTDDPSGSPGIVHYRVWQKADKSILEPYYGRWKVVGHLGDDDIYRRYITEDINEVLGKELRLSKEKASFGDKETADPKVEKRVMPYDSVWYSNRVSPSILGMKKGAAYNQIRIKGERLEIGFYVIDDGTLVMLREFRAYKCVRVD